MEWDTNFDWADIVDEAVARAGGEETTAADVLKLRRSFRILTERWTAQGFNTWRLGTWRIGISGTVPFVQLSECVDDVFVVNSIVNTQNNEASMRRVSAAEYAQLTAKNTQGRPSQWWLQRTMPPMLNIFPIGDPNTVTTLVIYGVERPEEFKRYSGADDVPGRWLEALVTGMALDLARKRPPLNEALIARLKGDALEAETLAQRADRDRANYRRRINVGYRGRG